MVTWDDVKQILKVLWLEENWELERIVREMRNNRGFHQVFVLHIPFSSQSENPELISTVQRA